MRSWGGGVVASLAESDLRAAMEEGGIVTFGVSGTLGLDGPLVIAKDTVLSGAGFSVTLTAANSNRLVTIMPGISLSLSNLTLARGVSTNGGAIYNNQGILRMSACILENNSAIGITTGSGGLPGFGGAIFNNQGEVTMLSCTISNNQARGGNGSKGGFGVAYAGGAAKGGGIHDYLGRVQITNCFFVYNAAQGGAGIPSDGVAGASGGEASGGCLWSEGGTISICKSMLYGNSSVGGEVGLSVAGGALALTSAKLLVSGCHFLTNQIVGGDAGRLSAGGRSAGGALSMQNGVGTVEHTVFSGNQVLPNNGGSGGAITTDGELLLQSCSFVSNSVRGWSYPFRIPGKPSIGGAIYASTNVSVLNCSFIGNAVVAQAGGDVALGGSACGGGIYTTGALAVADSSFVGNSALGGSGGTGYEGHSNRSGGAGGPASGGAIWSSGNLNLTNVTVALNSTVGGTGGLLKSIFGETTATATGGSATAGGISTSAGTNFFTQITVASNTVSGGSGNPGGDFTGGGIVSTNGVCLIYNSICSFNQAGDLVGNIDGHHNLIATDPHFGPLDLSDDRPMTLPLLSDSPAIDVGDANFAPATDQRGKSRPYGSGPDLGAYEWTGTVSTADFRITSIAWTNGCWLVSGEGPANVVVRLSLSLDLIQWLDLGSVTTSPDTGRFSIPDLAPEARPCAFYRLLPVSNPRSGF
jgi:hypothetical protein